MTERFKHSPSIQFSNELSPVVDNLPALRLAHEVPANLQPLLDHLRRKVSSTTHMLESEGENFQICGPDWCREHAEIAGQSHADVIIKTYGATYALPNKDPKVNVEALGKGDLDMYLIFRNSKPVGTACMVIGDNGWAELGRSASLGRVGNQVIQDLRIIRWLTEEKFSNKVFGLFSTLRTAPDRNIGTEEKPDMMRGGQSVSHIWSILPEVKVGGFGPLYKKHGALEQFAYAFVTNRDQYIPAATYIYREEGRKFVADWAEFYGIKETFGLYSGIKAFKPVFSVHYPPLETKLTHLIHGEITLVGGGESYTKLDKALAKLNEVQVPFIQVQVPIDVDLRSFQATLLKRDFVPFLFTPGVSEKQPPLLWYGRITEGVSVVPTYWDLTGENNPFWNSELSKFASTVSAGWNKTK